MTRAQIYRLIEQLEEATVAKAYAEERYNRLKETVMEELMQHYPIEKKEN